LVTQNGGVRSHDSDGRRWLDLFSDEQINAMKNDPLDDCVEAEIEIGKMS
jgi:hypothetical protein